jgi:hypothetical protein
MWTSGTAQRLCRPAAAPTTLRAWQITESLGAFRFFVRAELGLYVSVTCLICPPVGPPVEILALASVRYPCGSRNACLW